MKILKNESEALKAAEMALQNCPNGAFIDVGSYKGGMYDCFFILDPFTGEELFSVAY